MARAASVIQMRRIMTIVVKERDPLVVPRSTHETQEQRRIIDAQLAEGLDDILRGRVSERFDTVERMLASLKG